MDTSPSSPQISCDQRIMDALLSVVAAAGKDDSRLRPITLELSCLVLRQLLMLIDADQARFPPIFPLHFSWKMINNVFLDAQHHAIHSQQGSNDSVWKAGPSRLHRESVSRVVWGRICGVWGTFWSIPLEKWFKLKVNHIKFDIIGYEMLLPPCTTALSGLPLHKRLPSGFEEKIRSVRLFKNMKMRPNLR